MKGVQFVQVYICQELYLSRLTFLRVTIVKNDFFKRENGNSDISQKWHLLRVTFEKSDIFQEGHCQ